MHFVCFFIGSARRKLTCTICNRKCSSSLNLQEHRKVSFSNIFCTAQFIPGGYFALDLRGFAQLTQFCMIHFYSDVSLVPFLALQWYPSISTVSVTQSNLLILRLLHMLQGSFIPSLRSGLNLFGMTEQREDGGFFFTSSSHRSVEIDEALFAEHKVLTGSPFLLMDYRFEFRCLNSSLKHFYTAKINFIAVYINPFSVHDFSMSNTCDQASFSKLHSSVEQANGSSKDVFSLQLHSIKLIALTSY